MSVSRNDRTRGRQMFVYAIIKLSCILYWTKDEAYEHSCFYYDTF